MPDTKKTKTKRRKSAMMARFLDEQRDFRSHAVKDFDGHQRNSQEKHKKVLDETVKKVDRNHCWELCKRGFSGEWRNMSIRDEAVICWFEAGKVWEKPNAGVLGSR